MLSQPLSMEVSKSDRAKSIMPSQLNALTMSGAWQLCASILVRWRLHKLDLHSNVSSGDVLGCIGGNQRLAGLTDFLLGMCVEQNSVL